MTNLVDRPTPRGQRRRQQLVDAGVALLGEGGWSAVTTRAVAEHSGANQGLIHYHFGGLPGLHVAIAERAAHLVIEPVLDQVSTARDEHEALDRLAEVLPATTTDDRTTRLAAELIAGASRDPALGELLRDALRHARDEVAARLGALHPDLTEQQRGGTAILAVAAIDGLLLHLILDPELAVHDCLVTLRALVTHLRRTDDR